MIFWKHQSHARKHPLNFRWFLGRHKLLSCTQTPHAMSIIWVQESLSLLQRLWIPFASAIFGYIWERFAIFATHLQCILFLFVLRAYHLWPNLMQGPQHTRLQLGFRGLCSACGAEAMLGAPETPVARGPQGAPKRARRHCWMTSNYFTTQFISWFSCFVSFNSRFNKIYRRLILMNWNDSERIEKPHILSYQLLFLFAHM